MGEGRRRHVRRLKQELGPAIDPIPVARRPRWSVMIPCYNRTTYLAATLESILVQDPGHDQMQIEVVDNCSPDVDVLDVVRRCGNQRVNYFRQPRTVSLPENWNTCLRRARGEIVHVLSDDDLVLPGFYSRLEFGFSAGDDIGAAFCRYAVINESGGRDYVASAEQDSPGVLVRFAEAIFRAQRIQVPSIAVRRTVYETLGGFREDLIYASDWEMWRRIAVHYAYWYEPEVLAEYRMHGGSITSDLKRSGRSIADNRRSIEISARYRNGTDVPRAAIRAARRRYAWDALDDAEAFVQAGDCTAASAQIRGAMLTCVHPRHVYRGLRLIAKMAAKWALSRH